MDITNLNDILTSALKEISEVDVKQGLDSVVALRNKYLSKKSELMSCMSLLGKMEVEERKISVEELLEAQKNGTLEEVFGTGTAAVISPVGKLRYMDDVMVIGDGNIGPVSQKLYDTVTGIQWGKLPDELGWVVEL